MKEVSKFYKFDNSLYLRLDVGYKEVLNPFEAPPVHYNDVKMGAMASQNTKLTIVYSTVYPGAVQRKHQSSASLEFVAGNSPMIGEFPTQRASNAENVSIS